MAEKPENAFIHRLHKKFREAPYIEKMYNPLRAGTPDIYYSGHLGDLWVEYKYVTIVPISEKILPDLTPRQRRWLNGRMSEGRNVAVILGTPDGGVIYRNGEWTVPLSQSELLARQIPLSEVAKWITSQVGVSKWQSLTSF